jgi:glycerate dehydrogenase
VANSGTPLIVFLDRDTLPGETAVKRPDFEHELRVFGATAPGEVAARVKDADIVITNKAPLDAASIAGATRLRFVAVAATGYDIVDIEACKARGIDVSNIRNYAANTVPEHTFALILALRRSIIPYRASVAAGRWLEVNQFSYFDYPVNDLAGSTLGIIGDGVIGQAVAQIGRAFGMRPLFSSYKGVSGMGPLYTPFEEMLERSDVITLHSPLMPSTRNMIGRAEFGLMTRKPLLINTARGGLVDEDALAEALETGQISGAGFDVTTVEPPPASHVMMRLLERDNFILTPHVAWSSREAIQTLADQLIENVNLFWRGTPRNLLTHI